jgi:hypothetical protein
MAIPMYLLNPVSFGSAFYKAGALVSTTNEQAHIDAAGGILWPASDPVVAAAAVNAQRAGRQGAESAATGIMLAAAAQSASGGGSPRTVTVTANYTANPGEYVRVITTGGNVTVVFPGGLGEGCTVRKCSSDSNYVVPANLDSVGIGALQFNIQGAAVTTRGNGTNAEVIS